MIKRALLCGLGKAYSTTPLNQPAELPLEEDLKSMIGRLSSPALGEAWASIDVIDDSPKSVFNGEKNQVAMAYDLMASKENIQKSLSELAAKGADLILFYYSGHGDAIGDGTQPENSFNMLTYNDEFFKKKKPLAYCRHEKLFFDDAAYLSHFEELLAKYPGLNIITIIDCCYSSVLLNKVKRKNMKRNLFFCSGPNEARTNTESGSFFTQCFVKSATSSSTYLVFQNSINNMYGSGDISNLTSQLNNIQLPF